MRAKENSKFELETVWWLIGELISGGAHYFWPDTKCTNYEQKDNCMENKTAAKNTVLCKISQ